MSRLAVRNEPDLEAETIDALQPARNAGRLAEVYLQFANSESALRAYLGLEQALRDGSLSARECEAIKLRVSQITGCRFCLSTHTLKARQAGLDLHEQRLVRGGEPLGDARLDALLSIVDHLVRIPGPIPDELLNRARGEGIDDACLMDLALATATIFFTNIANHINDTQSSLPPAPALT